MQTMEYREINVDDIDKSSWIEGETHRRYLKDLIEFPEKEQSKLFGVFVDGGLIAYCGIKYAKYDNSGFLVALTVKSDLRGQGIGASFVEFLENQIIENGKKFVKLSVEQKNAGAQKLYDRLGYKIVDSDLESWLEDAPDGTTQLYTTDTFIMSKTLDSK